MYLLLGPIRLHKSFAGFSASWTNLAGETRVVPIPAAGELWLMRNLSLEQLCGQSDAWIPLSMLWDAPGWRQTVHDEFSQFGMDAIIEKMQSLSPLMEPTNAD